MREIVYIGAGESSNYVATHFWNTQQAYFTYGEDEQSFVDHDISWREGYDRSGNTPTYCPRALIIDYKSKFGTLSQNSELNPQQNTSAASSLWAGQVVEHRQEPIPESTFEDDPDLETKPGGSNPSTSKARYWSDFSQAYFIPRSIHRLPDPPEDKQPGWNSSIESFHRYDQDNEFVESSLRAFLEECDNLQGLNILSDSADFGGFIISLLEAFREEYPKNPVLCNLIHSDAIGDKEDTTKNRIKILADAMCIHRLNELDCLTSLVSLRRAGEFATKHLGQGSKPSVFDSSKAIAMMYESATLSCRIRNTSRMDSLWSMTSLLNWRGDNRFVNLTGASRLPLSSLSKEGSGSEALYDFSGLPTDGTSGPDSAPFAVYSATRGLLDCKSQNVVSEYVARESPTANYTSHLSFPPTRSIYNSLPQQGEATVPIFSAYTTTPSTAVVFKQLAMRVETFMKEKSYNDVNVDELPELRDSLWTIHDGYSVGESVDEGEPDDI